MSNLDLATLKFKVETGELVLAIKKVEELASKTKELAKSSAELMKADRLAAEATLAQANAQIKLINVQIKQLDVENKQAASRKKVAEAKEKEAKAQLQEAKAKESNAKATLSEIRASEVLSRTKEREAKASQKASDLSQNEVRASERKVRAKNQEIDSGDALTKMITKLNNQTQFVVEGNSRAESSFLAVIKSLGATEQQMKAVTQQFDIQRRVIGGDPFDKSASAANKLSRELDIVNGLLLNYGTTNALTRKQAKDLGQEIERLTQLAKQEGKTVDETKKLIESETAAYIKNAKAINLAEENLKSRTRQADEAARAANRLAEAQKRLSVFEGKQAFRNTSDPELPKGIITNLANYRKLLMDVGLEGTALQERMDKMQKVLVNTEAQRKSTTAFEGLAKSIVGAAIQLAAFNGVAGTVSSVFRITDMLANLEARMNAVGQGTTNFNRDFASIVSISNQTGSSIESVGTVFTRLLPVMQNFGKGSADALKITSNLAAVLRISGVSASEASAGMLQISQAFNKGKLDGDEFRSVAENMPEVLRLIEAQTGKSRAALYQMSEQGKITAALLSDVLGRDIQSLNDQLSQMPLTISVATNMLSNSFTLVVKKFDEVTGVSNLVANAIRTLSDAMTALAQNDGAVRLLTGVGAALATMAGVAAIAGGISLVSGAIGGLTVAAGLFNATAGRATPFGILLGLASLGVGIYTALSKPVDKIKEMTGEITNLTSEIERFEKGLSEGKVWVSRGVSRVLTADEKAKYQAQIDAKKKQLADIQKRKNTEVDNQTREANKTNKATAISSLSSDQRSNLDMFEQSKVEYSNKDKETRREDLMNKLKNVNSGMNAAISVANSEFELNSKNMQKGTQQYLDEVAKRDYAIRGATKASEIVKRGLEEDLKSLDKKISGPIKKKQLEAIKFEDTDVLRNLERTGNKEIEVYKRTNSIMLGILEDRFNSGQISAEQFYAEYFNLSKEGLDGVNQLYDNLNLDYLVESAALTESYKKSLNEFKTANKGVEEYTKHVAEATEKYNDQVKDLTEKYEGLTRVQEENKKLALAEYFKRLSDATTDLSKQVNTLKKELEGFANQEALLIAQQKEAFEFERSKRGLSEQEIAGVTAAYETRKRYLAQIKDSETKLNKILVQRDALQTALKKSSSGSDEAVRINKELEITNEQIEKLEKGLMGVKEGMTSAAQSAYAEATRQFQQKEFDDFVQGINDAIFTGITKGAKAGARSLRELLLEELKKPLTVFIKAVVSDLTGQRSGSGGILQSTLDLFSGKSTDTSSFGSIGKLVSNFSSLFDSSKLLSNIGSYLGITSATTGASGGAGLISGANAVAGSTIGSATGATGSGFVLGSTGATGSGLVLSGSTATGTAGAIAGANATAGAGTAAAGGVGASAVLGPLAIAYAAYKIGGMLYDMGYNKDNTADYGGLEKMPKGLGIVGPVGVSGAIHNGLKAIGINDKLAGMLSGSTMLSALFGRQKKVYTKGGFSGEFSDSGFNGMSFREWKQKGGLFRSNSSGTEYSGLDSEFAKSLTEAFVGIKQNAAASAVQLGLSSEAIKGYSKTVKLYMTDNQQENQAKIQEVFKTMSDELAVRLVPNIQQFANEGERLGDTLKRIATNLTSANNLLALTNVKLLELSVSNSALATELIETFGTIEKMQESVGKYYSEFFTQEEQMINGIKSMSITIAALGYQMPRTKEQFRTLIESLDVTTESGRNAYSTLIQLAPAFAELTASTSKLKEVAVGIKDTIKSISMSGLTPENNFKQQIADFDSLVIKASTATGEERVKLAEKVNSSLQPLIDSAKSVYASSPEFFALQDKVFNKANIFADAIAGTSVATYEEKTMLQFSDMNNSLKTIAQSSQLTVNELKSLLGLVQKTEGVTGSGSTVNYSEAAKLNEKGKGMVAEMLSPITNAQSGYDNALNYLASAKQSNEANMAGGLNGETSVESVLAHVAANRKHFSRKNRMQNVNNYINALQTVQQAKATLDQATSSTKLDQSALQAVRDQIITLGGVPMFAKGGAFSNGVVSQPTAFNMGVMGEKTPEAIMPLTRASDGSLGVRSSGSNLDISPLVSMIGVSNKSLEALVRLQQTSNMKIIEKLDDISERLEGLESAARLEASR